MTTDYSVLIFTSTSVHGPLEWSVISYNAFIVIARGAGYSQIYLMPSDTLRFANSISGGERTRATRRIGGILQTSDLDKGERGGK